jgi:hypothetical protein
MATCADWSFLDRRLGNLAGLARSVSRYVTGVRGYSRRRWRRGRGGSGAKMLVRRWWICCSSPNLSMGGDRQHGDIPRMTCHNNMCLAACSSLFTDSQSLVGYDAFSNLATAEVWCLFRRSSSRRGWSWAATARYGGRRKS